jgi:proteasome-associated ATPase
MANHSKPEPAPERSSPLGSQSTEELIRHAAELVPPENRKLANYMTAIEKAVAKDSRSMQEIEAQMHAYEKAYEELSKPASRLGVFIKSNPDGSAIVAVGDSEYLAQVDPLMDKDLLKPGVKLMLNEAYAILGVIDPNIHGRITKVNEVLTDGRLRVGGDAPSTDGGFLVYRAESLKDTALKSGDEVRLDSSGLFAVEYIASKEARDYFMEEVPELPWERVGGQEQAIKLIRDTIEQPLLYPEIFEKFEKKPIKGILLYGPPGCGKTLIGKATAYNLTKNYSERLGKPVKEYFMYISGPKILNMWLGETERMVREIFQTAREKAKEGYLVFIFMDEAESLLRQRSGARWLNISNTVVPQFCAELDGMVALENVVLILTSNRPDYIDPAILRPERIDRKVKINRPDRKSAEQILGIYLHAKIPLDPEELKRYDGDVDCTRKYLIESAVDFLWGTGQEQSFLKVRLKSGASESLYWKDLVSGALLKSVIDRAKDMAIQRQILEPKKVHGVRLGDLLEAIKGEYKENEIFPKSDTMDDWLKLLDYEPENVAAVKPIGPSRGEDILGKSIL